MNGLMLSTSGETWKPVPAKTKAALLERINAVSLDIPSFNPDNCQVQQIPLTFYKSAKLVFATDPTWMEPWEGYYFVVAGKKIYRLNGDSNVIHDMNKDIGLSLTSQNVRDYLIYFSTFIMGDSGTFPILATRSKKGAFISPKIIKKTKAAFILEAHALYDNFVFKCEYEILTDGMVTMTGDLPVACLESAMHYNPHYRLPSSENQQIH
jgi:hypothetical protein